ncbi:hypothetical protein FN846DRAFT_908321 [Sphaerosporella brunnea]|uniref:Uncharacterized protein n=1 Tax=Sphaerosporella brunnea TaxID=1250544 RepID=A0A5J5ETV2_9PEZI|nr:hypothetical protein FN846DRAFT_908321 [Sphaerosporella brunnea]
MVRSVVQQQHRMLSSRSGLHANGTGTAGISSVRDGVERVLDIQQPSPAAQAPPRSEEKLLTGGNRRAGAGFNLSFSSALALIKPDVRAFLCCGVPRDVPEAASEGYFPSEYEGFEDIKTAGKKPLAFIPLRRESTEKARYDKGQVYRVTSLGANLPPGGGTRLVGNSQEGPVVMLQMDPAIGNPRLDGFSGSQLPRLSADPPIRQDAWKDRRGS